MKISINICKYKIEDKQADKLEFDCANLSMKYSYGLFLGLKNNM